jgi:NADH-quinone oxidoreductase subunit E
VSTVDLSDIFFQTKGEEGDLIPILQHVQEKYGFLSEESIREISHFLKISENQIYGVASFYAQFRFTEPGRHTIKVCLGTACHVKGGQSLCNALEKGLRVSPGQTTEDKRFDLQRVACLGCCALSPVMMIDKDIHSNMNSIKLKDITNKYE